ncbi:MAG: sodium:solute symporter [Bacteroidetes bacterium]|nr:sodium:solute symporter [Bacteroidota bacterium]
MSNIDWIVLCLTMITIIVYGMVKSRGQKDLNSYFLNNRSMPWYMILFSIMATQASAITFLSAPGQAYTDGMRFVQYYFGLPLAMIFICIFLLPVYQKLNIYTAYEYLEQRFDRKTRLLTSFLFLLQRGLSTGISIYAPSIILSSLMGWNIYITNVIMGGFLIIYTVSGGVKAISYTQTQQLIIIFIAMFIAGYMLIHLLPDSMNFMDSLSIAGASQKLNVITTGFTEKGFDWKDKYNLFSGIIGGFFLALSYFGTDQSQVGRYLTAKNLSESRRGLLMNGFVKIPMQFLILLVGAMVFTFYTIYEGPINYNSKQLEQAKRGIAGEEIAKLESQYSVVRKQNEQSAIHYLDAKKRHDIEAEQKFKNELTQHNNELLSLRKNAAEQIKISDPLADTNDTNYIFLHFVVHHLPKGLVGLLIAIIFLAAWGSIAAALNSLASTCVVDWHHQIRPKDRTDKKNLFLSRLYTFGWGIFSIVVASIAGKLGSLIEAVNILGSLFYGTILGIFMVALFLKSIKGHAVFIAALITEVLVIAIYFSDTISFLWLNLIGCFLVIFIAFLLNLPIRSATNPT